MKYISLFLMLSSFLIAQEFEYENWVSAVPDLHDEQFIVYWQMPLWSANREPFQQFAKSKHRDELKSKYLFAFGMNHPTNREDVFFKKLEEEIDVLYVINRNGEILWTQVNWPNTKALVYELSILHYFIKNQRSLDNLFQEAFEISKSQKIQDKEKFQLYAFLYFRGDDDVKTKLLSLLARQEISFLLLGLSDESLRVRMLAQAAIEKKDPGKYTFDVWADKHIRETALAKLKESQ